MSSTSFDKTVHDLWARGVLTRSRNCGQQVSAPRGTILSDFLENAHWMITEQYSDHLLFLRELASPGRMPSSAVKIAITRNEYMLSRPYLLFWVFTSLVMSSTLALLSKHKGAVSVAAVANTASMLFGYDTGVAGSVVALRR